MKNKQNRLSDPGKIAQANITHIESSWDSSDSAPKSSKKLHITNRMKIILPIIITLLAILYFWSTLVELFYSNILFFVITFLFAGFLVLFPLIHLITRWINFILDKKIWAKHSLMFIISFFLVFVLITLFIVKLNDYEQNHHCSFRYNSDFGWLWDLYICYELPASKYQLQPGSYWLQLHKPLILLYPETEQEVSVELEYTPGFSATFPLYDNAKKGWSVTANPDGTLLDHSTNQETYGLFWEGNLTHANYNTSKGWVIKGWEVREFLYEKLTEIGLNTKEKSDFIMFWYPKLQKYPYIQITFAGEDYNQSAPLKITPKPDSLLRVFMVAQPLDAPKKIEPQTLDRFQRKGFSVVEWGGTIVE